MYTVAQILEALKKLDNEGKKYGIEIYVAKSNNVSYHTDDIDVVDLDNWDFLECCPKAVVRDFNVMTRELYNETVCANCSQTADDIWFDDYDFMVCILLPQQPKRLEPQIRPIDFENLWDFADAWNNLPEIHRYCDYAKWNHRGGRIYGDIEGDEDERGYNGRLYKTVTCSGWGGDLTYEKSIATEDEIYWCEKRFFEKMQDEEVSIIDIINPAILED